MIKNGQKMAKSPLLFEKWPKKWAEKMGKFGLKLVKNGLFLGVLRHFWVFLG